MAVKYSICVILMIKLVVFFTEFCVKKIFFFKGDKVRHISNAFKVSSRRNHVKYR